MFDVVSVIGEVTFAAESCVARCALVQAVNEVIEEIPGVRNVILRKKKAIAYAEKVKNNCFGAAVNERIALLVTGRLPEAEDSPAPAAA